MVCPSRCSCSLCRELCAVSAEPRACSTGPPARCDNFILKKPESSALRFLRGAARFSVRRWRVSGERDEPGVHEKYEPLMKLPLSVPALTYFGDSVARRAGSGTVTQRELVLAVDRNYEQARRLERQLGDHADWSYVQRWRRTQHEPADTSDASSPTPCCVTQSGSASESEDTVSSGLASMSDGDARAPWSGGGLREVRRVVERLAGERSDSCGESPEPSALRDGTEPAQDFVWLDATEWRPAPAPPPTGSDAVRALAASCRASVSSRQAAELARLVRRPLARVLREARRLSSVLGVCSAREVSAALRLALPPSLADVAEEGARRAAAMYATADCGGTAVRARTALSPGGFLRWMVDERVAPFVHEFAAVHLCGAAETLLERMAVAAGAGGDLEPASTERALLTTAEFRALLCPPDRCGTDDERDRVGSTGSTRSSAASSLSVDGRGDARLSRDSGIADRSGGQSSEGSDEDALRCTCAGSPAELRALLRRCSTTLSPGAEAALFYFVRCERGARRGPGAPLSEWLRVMRESARVRPPPCEPDRDDVLQAARLLLPHTDCPPRALTPPPTQFLTAGLDLPDAAGLTPLMKAAALGDQRLVTTLLEAGAAPDVESPGALRSGLPAARASMRSGPYTPPTAGWTALVFACAAGHKECARRLLAAGARVEGAAVAAATLSPLQVACGSGDARLVRELTARGADPHLSTRLRHEGCPGALAVCAWHGHRTILRALLSARPNRLSLEEMLAEGADGPLGPGPRRDALTDALYWAAETGRPDIALELTAAGAPWTLHAWRLSLASSAARPDLTERLLAEFSRVCPSDDALRGERFVDECLPLLFHTLGECENEAAVRSAADIVSRAQGQEPAQLDSPWERGARRVDPTYVNNPELADVTFRAEGRALYAHRIVLASESPRLRTLLAGGGGGATVEVRVEGVRYAVLERAVRHVYTGVCDLPPEEALETLACAAGLGLRGLVARCEAAAAAADGARGPAGLLVHAELYGARRLARYCRAVLLCRLPRLLHDPATRALLRSPARRAALLRHLQHHLRPPRPARPLTPLHD